MVEIGDLVDFGGRVCLVRSVKVGELGGPHARLSDWATGEYVGLVAVHLLRVVGRA
jgi:hypothetical protein